MRNWFTAVTALTFLTLGIAAAPAAAQTPRAEISGGYQFVGAKSASDDNYEKFKKGWYADVAGNAGRVLGIVGNIGGNYKTLTEGNQSVDFSVHQFLVGPRVSGRAIPMVVPFGQVLFGGTRVKAKQGSTSLSDTSFTVAAGGGINLMVTPKAGVRGGIDYFHVNKKSGSDLLDESVKGYRINVGLVVTVG